MCRSSSSGRGWALLQNREKVQRAGWRVMEQGGQGGGIRGSGGKCDGGGLPKGVRVCCAVPRPLPLPLSLQLRQGAAGQGPEEQAEPRVTEAQSARLIEVERSVSVAVVGTGLGGVPQRPGTG